MSSFAAQAWKRLSAINVNEHVEKKGQLSYLSWTWAWQTLMDNYPESTVEYLEHKNYADNTFEIGCKVTVREGDSALTRECWLPVMDNRNNAVQSPNARQISDTRQRCLTKCIALHGLGLYIYAGEDLPEAKKEEQKEDRQQRLADWTIKLDEQNDIASLRLTLQDAMQFYKALRDKEGLNEVKRIAEVKADEIKKYTRPQQDHSNKIKVDASN